MTYKNKKVRVSVIYHSPNRDNNEFDLFLSNFENILSDILSVCVTAGNFSTRSFPWWPKEINTKKGSKFFKLTSSRGFSQLIKEPTHIETSSFSCIDLVFTD